MNYITSADVWDKIKRRNADTHKGSYGNVLCVAGSAEYRGAAALCALSTLRGGAGLVTLASSETVIQSVAGQILEATFLPLPSELLLEKAEKASCIVIGCGMHQNAETAALCKQLLPIAKTAVIDAGALCAISLNDTQEGALSILEMAKNVPIITPHPGEMAMLCKVSTEDVQKNREKTASQFARENRCIVVLKGSRTLVCDEKGECFQNSTGNAGLARGGSGDILAGLIAAFAANGIAPADAAKAAVYLHGHAADLCAARLSMQGMLPHDILTDLCTIFKDNGR